MEFNPPLTMSDQCMLRKLIKTQIQLLIDQLQQQTDTETFIVLGHRSTDFEQIGSNKGLQFLSSVGKIGSQFTEYIQTDNLVDDKGTTQAALQGNEFLLVARKLNTENVDSDCASDSDIFYAEEEEEDYELMEMNGFEDDAHSEHPVVKTEEIPGGSTEDFNGNWDTENMSNDEKRLEETHLEQATTMNGRYEASASIAVAANLSCNVPETILGGKALQKEPPAIESQLQGEELLEDAASQHYEKLTTIDIIGSETKEASLPEKLIRNKVQMDWKSEEFSNDGHEENMSINEKVLEKTHLEQITIMNVRSLASVSDAKEMGSLKEMTDSNTVVGIQSVETSSNDVDGIETQGIFLSEPKHILSAHEEIIVNGGYQETGRTDEVSHDNIASDLNTNEEKNENACHVETRYSQYSKPKQSHSQSKIQCKTCGKQFKSKGHLRDHMTTHDGVSRVHCIYCNEKFKWRYQRQIHVKKQHYDILERKPYAKGTKSSKLRSNSTKTVAFNKRTLSKTASDSIKTIKDNSHCEPESINKNILSVLSPVVQIVPIHLKTKNGEANAFPAKDAFTCINGTGPSLECSVKTPKLRTKYKPKCKYCSRKYRTESELKEHEHTHTGVYSCWKCGSNFSDKKQLREHVKPCRKVPSFKAVGKKPRIEMKTSMGKEPSVAEKTLLTNKSAKEKRSTIEKKSVLEKKSDLEETFANENKSVNKCQKCNKKFMYVAVLKNHESSCGTARIRKSLRKKTDGLKNKDHTTLSQCGKKVTSFEHKKHWKCQKCNKTFLYPANFKKHENVCNAAKVNGKKASSGLQNTNKTDKTLKFPCEYCSRTFNSKFEVFRHLCVHTKEERFACRFCRKKFKWIEPCKKHELIKHENDLPVRNLHLSTSISRALGRNIKRCSFCNVDFGNEIFSVHVKCCKAFRKLRQMDSSAIEGLKKRNNVDEDVVANQAIGSNHTVQDKPGYASSVENSADSSPSLGHASVTKSSPSKPQHQPGEIVVSIEKQKQNYRCAICSASFGFSREIVEHIEEAHEHEILKDDRV